MRLRGIGRRAWTAVAPGNMAWRGAAWGITLTAFTLWLVYAYAVFAPFSRLALGVALLSLTLVALLIGGLTLAALAWLRHWPPVFKVALVVGGIFLGVPFSGYSWPGLATLAGWTAMMGALAGAGVAALWRGRGRRETAVRRATAWVGFLLGGAGLLGGAAWLVWPGPALPAPPIAAQQGGPVALLDLPDPAQPGPYAVLTLTYGSGNDQHRPEFGAEADLLTTPVNGDPFVSGWTELRTWYWGFDEGEMPRNGRVWYPDAPGPFPLLLMVHGNHDMSNFSDGGYPYLGELLASRGFIFVSVDQNFLNGSAVANWLGEKRLTEENDARGWLLLEHLRLWRDWQNDAANPFYQRIDLENIALLGHSRGGEAVAIAAAFNQLSRYPDNGRIQFNYQFNIRSVVAIAPVDGQYTPADAPTPLTDVHYLALHGSHDMDVTSFAGMQQFDRVSFTGDEGWKTAVYVYGANHGQFNQSWGRADTVFPRASLYNLGQLIPAAQQEQIAQVFITAFLEATLHEQTGYVALFRDVRAGQAWLPTAALILTRYEDAQMRFWATYEEDVDLITSSGGTAVARYLTTWQEGQPPQKWGNLASRGVQLGWQPRSGESAAYTLTLPPDFAVPPNGELVFSLADAEAADPQREPVDLSVEVADGAGETAVLPLSHFLPLQPQLEAQLFKLAYFSDAKTAEAVYQSFFLPLADFAAVNEKLDVRGVTAVTFRFDRTPEGKIWLDNVGFR